MSFDDAIEALSELINAMKYRKAVLEQDKALPVVIEELENWIEAAEERRQAVEQGSAYESDYDDDDSDTDVEEPDDSEQEGEEDQDDREPGFAAMYFSTPHDPAENQSLTGFAPTGGQ
jgi:hypothetical protein